MCFTQQTICLSLGSMGVCVIQGTFTVLIHFPLKHPGIAFYGLCSDQTVSKGELKLSSLAFLKIKQNKEERRVCVSLCGLRSSAQTRSKRRKWAGNVLDSLSCWKMDSAQKLPLQLKAHLPTRSINIIAEPKQLLLSLSETTWRHRRMKSWYHSKLHVV